MTVRLTQNSAHANINNIPKYIATIRDQLVVSTNGGSTGAPVSVTTIPDTKMSLMAVDNLLAGLNGEQPPDCPNPEALQVRSQKG